MDTKLALVQMAVVTLAVASKVNPNISSNSDTGGTLVSCNKAQHTLEYRMDMQMMIQKRTLLHLTLDVKVVVLIQNTA